jgi:outer membrane receptor protein involved in Fe transport
VSGFTCCKIGLDVYLLFICKAQDGNEAEKSFRRKSFAPLNCGARICVRLAVAVAMLLKVPGGLMLKMLTKRIKFAACCLALLCAAGGSVLAQSTTQGAIGGTVFDPTNAAIAKASVTIHNDATNAEQTLISDDSGYFKAPLLEPGTYTVTVAAAGFGSYKTDALVVLGQLTALTPHLKTGAESVVVEVTAQAPVLNFDSPEFTATLNERALADIPVNNQRWSSLALTTPGVVSESNGFGLVSIRGISPILNNVLIDGADDNQAYYAEERGRTREAYSTPPEAIREFTVNAGVYQAEFGRAAGGVINSVTKSGGNQIHGEAFFSDRESAWGAYNDYTTNTVPVYGNGGTVPTSFVTSPIKPEDSRRIWGFTAGGALIKDKLFWEYTYDQHRRIFPGTAKATNPTTFFGTLPDAAAPTGSACNLTSGYMTGASTIDSQACTLAAREGLTSYAAGALAYDSGLGVLLTDLGSVPRAGYQEVNMPKLDWQINGKNHVSFLYNRLRWDSPGGVQTQSTNDYAVDTFGMDYVKLDYGVAKLSSQIGSSISNELLYQFGRELNDESQQPYSAFTNQYLQGTGTSAGNVPEISLDSPSNTGFYLGSPYYSYRKALPDEHKWQIGDTLYLQHANHSLKFGVDMVHNYDLINNTYESNGYISYSYIGNFLADLASEGKANDTCNSSASSAGTSTTNAVGKDPCYSSFTQGFGPPVFAVSTMDYGFFAQDNWKVTPRLTLELGLRYDYEKLPGASANASLTAATQTSYTNPVTLAVTTTTFTPYAGLTNAPSDKNNIGPRVGFAYDVTGNGKSVVRGGYGMFYGRITNGILLNVLLNTGSPLGQYTATVKPSAGASAPVFPNIIPPTAPPTPSSYFLSPTLQNPMVHEFDLIYQQQIGKGTVASISYLGALGRELTNFVNTNLAPPQAVSTITVSDASGKGPLPNGAAYQVPVYTTCTTGSAGCTNPTGYLNPNFTSITEVTSNITSNYNAMAIEVQNHSLKSIEFDVNYVWSHALDYNQNATTTTSTNSQYDPDGLQGPDYGNSNFNVPDRVTGYVLYNLPGTKRGDWVKYLANNWSLNTAFQAQSGLPYSASIGSSNYPSYNALNSSWNGAGGTSWIPLIGRNTYKYPRDIVEDVRLAKQISFTDRYKAEARIDLYNVYNHQNVTGVATTAYALSTTSSAPNTATATYQTGITGSGTTLFGTPNNSNSSGFLYTPRQIAIGFKFMF